jgi:hypothetical protein
MHGSMASCVALAYSFGVTATQGSEIAVRKAAGERITGDFIITGLLTGASTPSSRRLGCHVHDPVDGVSTGAPTFRNRIVPRPDRVAARPGARSS